MSYLNRLRSEAAFYARELYRLIDDKVIFVCAQAVAFKVLVAAVPMVILVTGVVGRVLRRDEPYAAVARLTREFLPSYQTERLLDTIDTLQRISGTLTLIGTLGVVYAAISLFSTLRAVLANVFTEDWHDRRSILRGYAFDIRMALQVGVLFVATVAFTLYLRSFEVLGVDFFNRIGLQTAWLDAGWNELIRWLTLVLPVFVSTAMFFQLYYLIPVPHPPKRSVFVGSLMAAALWEVAKVLFAVYATRSDILESYTGSTVTGAIGDTFGLTVAVLLWAYYSGVVLMIGALIVLLHERRHRVPAPDHHYAGDSSVEGAAT